MTLSLKKSDVAAMALSTVYESGVQVPTAMKALEKVAYQVLGRMLGSNEMYKTYVPESLDGKDLAAGLIAFGDAYARKGQSIRGAAMSGAQESVASFVGKQALLMLGQDDTSLFGDSSASTSVIK